jgi:hypothetical protein
MLEAQVWNRDPSYYQVIKELRFDEGEVKEAIQRFFDKQWVVCKGVDPVTAPSDKVFCSTYLHWVGMPQEGRGARHMGQYMPRHLRRKLMALRLGCHPLCIQSQRLQKVERQYRYCPLCQRHGLLQVEDLCHFVLDCGYYSSLRHKHSNIFGNTHARSRGDNKGALLKAIFDHKHQMDLACCLSDMLRLREAELQQLSTEVGDHHTSAGISREVRTQEEVDFYLSFDTFDSDVDSDDIELVEVGVVDELSDDILPSCFSLVE